MKILIVDDERDIELLFVQQFRKELRRGGFEFVFTFSGQEAITVLESADPPDVVYVFSDINMPGMTGLELLEVIKDRFPMVTVSMISAYVDRENHQKALASGAKEFFTKPIDFQRLKQELQPLIGMQEDR